MIPFDWAESGLTLRLAALVWQFQLSHPYTQHPKEERRLSHRLAPENEEIPFPEASQQLCPWHLIGVTGLLLSQSLCPSECHIQFG